MELLRDVGTALPFVVMAGFTFYAWRAMDRWSARMADGSAWVRLARWLATPLSLLIFVLGITIPILILTKKRFLAIVAVVPLLFAIKTRRER